MSQPPAVRSGSTGPLPWTHPDHDDRPREECGVFAVVEPTGGAARVGDPSGGDAAVLIALGLHALQHRGQEGCGIVTAGDGGGFYQERHLGLVGDHFSGGDLSTRLPGHMGIGHTRYATQGATVIRNVQPLYTDLSFGGFAICHNGNLTNARALREELVATGATFQSTSDTECVTQLIARSRRAAVVERLIEAVQQIEGAYALVCLTGTQVIAARDPNGIRPLVLGRRGDALILASETCALEMIGAEFVREIENGEVVVIDHGPGGVPTLTSHRAFPARPARPCVFEFVYFARPDSIIAGRSVYEVRKRMGQRLAEETAIGADIVVPVPDSGVPAALGYAQRSGLPYEMGIVRSHFVGRTFIQPRQEIRALGVRLKHAANVGVLRGKRVVLVDDSIVRGTTSQKIVKLVREAGAREVHYRSASPPIRWPDFYGIDMPSREQLLAAVMSLEEMQRFLEVDTLGFLSVEGLYWALGAGERRAHAPQFTDHCFTGDYPTALADLQAHRAAKDVQLSFLVEA